MFSYYKIISPLSTPNFSDYDKSLSKVVISTSFPMGPEAFSAEWIMQYAAFCAVETPNPLHLKDMLFIVPQLLSQGKYFA
jgi:hypothetical protein